LSVSESGTSACQLFRSGRNHIQQRRHVFEIGKMTLPGAVALRYNQPDLGRKMPVLGRSRPFRDQFSDFFHRFDHRLTNIAATIGSGRKTVEIGNTFLAAFFRIVRRL
jgi:hypothetical protein